MTKPDTHFVFEHKTKLGPLPVTVQYETIVYERWDYKDYVKPYNILHVLVYGCDEAEKESYVDVYHELPADVIKTLARELDPEVDDIIDSYDVYYDPY